jgi:phosphinothricin acetyltransferase
MASEDDAPALARIYAPVVRETALSFETEPPDAAEMARRVRETLRFAPWLVWDEAGEVLGYAYATRFRARAAYDWTCEVSVYVDGGARRRGIARGLYARLFELLALQGFRTALAVIALPNPESVALHERLGFARVGTFHDTGFKHGAWRDTGWWSLRLGPGAAPAPTRSVAEAWALRSRSRNPARP